MPSGNTYFQVFVYLIIYLIITVLVCLFIFHLPGLSLRKHLLSNLTITKKAYSRYGLLLFLNIFLAVAAGNIAGRACNNRIPQKQVEQQKNSNNTGPNTAYCLKAHRPGLPCDDRALSDPQFLAAQFRKHPGASRRKRWILLLNYL